MGTYENLQSETYLVSCLTCGRLYDACEADWCECLTDNPTLACPHCGRCFCAESQGVLTTFWKNAPQRLWHRRLAKGFRGTLDTPMEIGNPLRRPLILVADDDDNTRAIAFKVLEALGYGVLLANDGKVALTLAKQFHPDLVLTDLLMPILNGKNLCKKLKENPTTRDIPVILMTGLHKKEKQRIEFLRDYRANDFLQKPISFERLGDVLGGWLSPIAAT